MNTMKLSFAELSKPFHLKMAEFQKSLDNATLSQDTKSIGEISKEFTTFKSFMVSALKNIQQQVDLISMQVDKSEMRSRRKMLLIHGVPESKDEDLTGNLLNLFTQHVSEIKVSENSFKTCHRMGHLSSEKARAILLKFKDISVRDSIWYSKSNFKGSGITVSEFLTKDRHDAFQAARKRFGITKCWTREGVIIIIGTDGSRHRAWCTKDVDAIPLSEMSVTESAAVAGTSIPHRKAGKDSPTQQSKRITSKSRDKAKKK